MIPQPAPRPFEVGLYGFAEVLAHPSTGRRASPAQRLADVVEEAVLADQVGLDVFGIGEHHRPEMFVSNPAVVLASLAAHTRRIRLTSAVSVLGSADPIRLFQDFATVDLLSGGRAEVMVGRGAFTESFPVYGYELADYETLFADNLQLLLQLRRAGPVTWTGAHRAALHGIEVQPRPVQAELPVWVGVGGTPSSAARAGAMGLPMALAVLGGPLAQGRAAVEAQRAGAARAGVAPQAVAVASHGFLADTSQQAQRNFYPHYAHYVDTYLGGRDRAPITPEAFDRLAGAGSALIIGSPQQAAEKMLAQHELLGNTRYLMQTSMGSVPHRAVMRSIELLGEVATTVRAAVSPAPSPVPSPVG